MKTVNPFKERLRFGSQLGLERITMLCQKLGNPQDRFKVIHVAGTNGKGSVASMMASVLSYNNYRTGLFTSPHLVDYRERFRIDGQLISPEQLEVATKKVNQAIGEIEVAYPDLGNFTEFEAATAVGFQYFADEKVDYGVIEVGLGGRLDATNVVQPEISVITPIGHDHQDRLGKSIAEVAWEKAGIIKQGIPIVTGYQSLDVDQVLKLRALDLACDYIRVADENWEALDWSLTGGFLKYPYFSDEQFEISLLGEHQLENAATVLTALRVLYQKGLVLAYDKIRAGMKEARWPGRLQILSHQPLVFLDGAHNEEGIAVLVKALSKLLKPQEKISFLIGLSANKSPSLLDPLFPFAKRMVITKAENSRIGALDPYDIWQYLTEKNIPAQFYPEIGEALAALKDEDQLCICGSLYLIGEILAKHQ